MCERPAVIFDTEDKIPCIANGGIAKKHILCSERISRHAISIFAVYTYKNK